MRTFESHTAPRRNARRPPVSALSPAVLLLSAVAWCTWAPAVAGSDDGKQRDGNRPNANRGGLDSCHATIGSLTRIRLNDSSTVSLDLESVSTNGAAVALVGSHVHIWPKGATRGTSPVREGSILGVVVDSTGRATAIPVPPIGYRAIYPRVAANSPRGWDLMFVTSSPNALDGGAVLDTATLWHGRFDGLRWRDVGRVTSVTGAALQAGLGSELVSVGNRLRFAFAFDQAASANHREQRGVVLLRQGADRWSEDTLVTSAMPHYVQLTAATDDALVLGIVQIRRRGAETVPTLTLTRYDSVWGATYVPERESGGGASRPILRALETGISVSWVTDKTNARPQRLHAATLTRDGRVVDRRIVATGDGVEDMDAIALDSARVVWLHRDGRSISAVRGIIQSSGNLHALGRFGIPLNNPRPRLAKLSPKNLLVLSSGLGQAPNDNPATSYVAQLRLHCR